MKRIAFPPKPASFPCKYRECAEYLDRLRSSDVVYEKEFVDQLIYKFIEATDELEVLRGAYQEAVADSRGKPSRRPRTGGRQALRASPPSPLMFVRAGKGALHSKSIRLELLHLKEECTAMSAHVLSLYSLVQCIEDEVRAQDSFVFGGHSPR